jgi:phosphoglucosamine mutase
LAISSLGVPFLRSKVGDRYVLETLREKDWKIGGETSGHVVCLDKTTTGDGIVAALQVLSIMVKQGKTLQQLTQGITLLPQSLVNLKTNRAVLLASNSSVIHAVKNLEESLKGEGRVLLRPSGTEPLLRVMVEGINETIVRQQAQKLCDEISIIDAQLTETKEST